MMESSLPLHVPPKTSTIRFRRTPEERNGRRVLTRFDPASILKLGTYAYSIRKDEISRSLVPVIAATKNLWRQYYLTYDQTHYVAKEVRRALAIERPKTRKCVVARLSREEERKFLAHAYRVQGTRGLLIKTLFQTGARVSEFVNITANKVFFEEQMILIAKAKGGKSRYVPILP
jgi:site-specific recombinase XerD